MPMPVARMTDMHVCPMVTGVVPHVGGPVLGPPTPTVLIGMMPAVGIGAMATCVGPPDAVVVPSPTVMIGGKPATKLTSSTTHGGTVVSGCPTVLIP